MPEDITTEQLADLTRLAYDLGATGAALLDFENIIAEDRLAAMCREPRCPDYGLSASCPPHVPGPEYFRGLLERMRAALFFKLDLPAYILLGGYNDDRRDIMRLVHEIAAGVENAARSMGAADSTAFAGGSCKKVFCHEHPKCRVVDLKSECRHPGAARPSLSGFGVNIKKMAGSVGWELWSGGSGLDDPNAMGIVVGLVLIG